MPPSSNTVSASSKSKGNPFPPSPDSGPILPEPEIQVPLTKKEKKKKNNASSKQVQNGSKNDKISTTEVTGGDSPPAARPQTILSQIPHAFTIPPRPESPISELQDDDITTTEKVSDQYTPPNDTWLADDPYSKNSPVELGLKARHSILPSVEPGFSTRARYASKSPPISPPVRYARPVSYGGSIPPVPTLPRASPSGYSYAPSAYGSPPAPHMPQQHFYHPQDINLGLAHNKLPFTKEEPSLVRYAKIPSDNKNFQHAVLLGFDHRLNVLRISNGFVDEIGMLEGLSGTVVDATLLEWNGGHDPFVSLRPMIAIVIHGPRQVSNDPLIQHNSDDTRPSSRQQVGFPSIEYTTRVEVFSLPTQQSLGTLLETPSQPSQSAFRGASPTPPGPIGCLRLQASGKFLTVSCGTSGELYAFVIVQDRYPRFECLGKFWTVLQPHLQRRDSSHHPSSDADVSPADMSRALGTSNRTISDLNGRWLALCPAFTPSRPSLGALLGPNVSFGRQAGVDATSAPVRPHVTCEVDSPDADTLLSKVARGVAQELVKGAKWLGDQGYQTWQSYWKKEQSSSGSGASPIYSPAIQPSIYAPGVFPPTHGESQRSSKEPELVAIYDLQALDESINRKAYDELKPLATFQPPRGCSFLSFAPHGLTLLTAGRKGDVQYVWDLLQIKSCRTYIIPSEDDRTRSQPRVRQIAKYERLSGSTIVDVIWDVPYGARFAVLTRNKTIHLFDLPQSSFRWPPPRPLQKSRPNSKSIDSTQHDMPVSSGFFASAMNIANQAQPMLANWRGRAPSMGGGFAGISQTGIGLASATGARGSKAVAAGLSKSLGAASETVSQIRHAGESRLHLKSNKEPSAGKIFWIRSGRKTSLNVVEADSVKQYQVHKNKSTENRENSTVFAARKAVANKFPNLARLIDGEETLPQRATQERGITQRTSTTGFWKETPLISTGTKPLSHPLSFAEIETNAPYQPFHSDRRVNLCVYSDSSLLSSGQHLTTSTLTKNPLRTKSAKSMSKWIFGEDIPSLTLNISKIQIPDDENDYSGSVVYRETVKVTSASAEDDEIDQIVSTTRRRKVKKSTNSYSQAGSDVDKDDGFFEDDCDVLDFATDRV